MLILINVRRQLITYSMYIHTGILLPGVCARLPRHLSLSHWCLLSQKHTLLSHCCNNVNYNDHHTHTAGFHPLMCTWLIRRASDITAQLQSLVRSPLTVSHMRHVADLTAGNFHTSSRNQGGDGSYWKTSAAVLVFQSMNDWFYFMFGCLQEPSLKALFKDINQIIENYREFYKYIHTASQV